ncbi:hypothetical protein MPER_09987 [Moniliophthora perniciosa FA553]|nr:hypothetical protein MPER_09987 [Moniliophthora perniciosa FA553]
MRMFEHQFDLPVLEHITLPAEALPSFLSKSNLPSLNSISLWRGIIMDNDLEVIRLFLAGPRSGTQIEEFQLRLCVPSLDIEVIDMIFNKLPRLASLEIHDPDPDLNLNPIEETIQHVIPKLTRFTQLRRFKLSWRWEEHIIWEAPNREQIFLDLLHTYIVDIGSRCPALQVCAIAVSWKRIVHGLWVPDNVPLRVQAAQWVFDKIRSESGYPGLIEHLETYSGSNLRVGKALFEYQTIQDDYKRIVPLMKVGEELGLWAFSPGFEAEINTTVD